MSHDHLVVVGVADGDDEVLQAGLAAAGPGPAAVHVVRAFLVPPSTMSSIYAVDVSASFRADAEHSLAVLVSRAVVPAGIRLVPSVVRGYPADVLVGRSHDADLVVVGSDAPRWSSVLSGGRVAARLARHSRCPVLVVPRDPSTVPAAWSGEVVAVVDAAEPATTILARAVEEAVARGSRLRVVQVAAAGSQIGRELDRADAVRALEWSTRDHPELDASVDLVDDRHAESVLAGFGSASCVVVGSLGLDDAAHRMLPFAHHVLDHTRVPVLVVPDQHRTQSDEQDHHEEQDHGTHH